MADVIQTYKELLDNPPKEISPIEVEKKEIPTTAHFMTTQVGFKIGVARLNKEISLVNLYDYCQQAIDEVLSYVPEMDERGETIIINCYEDRDAAEVIEALKKKLYDYITVDIQGSSYFSPIDEKTKIPESAEVSELPSAYDVLKAESEKETAKGE